MWISLFCQQMIPASLVCCIGFFLYFSFQLLSLTTNALCDSIWCKTEEYSRANAKVVLGTYLGEAEQIRLGIQDGGSARALLTPVLGQKFLKLGTFGVDFPFCPAVHIAFLHSTKNHLLAAQYLLNNGADLNAYELPQLGSFIHTPMGDWQAGSGLGYPPALLYTIGLGLSPTNAHAAFLQRLYLSMPHKFNFNLTERWRLESGSAPLTHIAIMYDFFDGLYVLVKELGFSTNECDQYGISTLHVAAWFGNTNAVKFLLHFGGDRTATDKFGRSPLHFAVIRGHSEVIGALLAPTEESNLSSLQRENLSSRDYALLQDAMNISVIDILGFQPRIHDNQAALRKGLLTERVVLRHIPVVKSGQISRFLDFDFDFVHNTTDIAIDHDAKNGYQQTKCRIGHARGGWGFPRLCSLTELEDCSCLRLTEQFTSGSIEDDRKNPALKSIISFEASIDCVDALDISPKAFFERYFSVQRPLLLSKLALPSKRIWGYWRKEDFLGRYGNFKSTYGCNVDVEEVLTSVLDDTISDYSDTLSHLNTIRDGIEYFGKHDAVALLTRNITCLEAYCDINLFSSNLLWQIESSEDALQTVLEGDIGTPNLFQLCHSAGANVCHLEALDCSVLKNCTDQFIRQDFRNENFDRNQLPRNYLDKGKLIVGSFGSGQPLHQHNASWNLLITGIKHWFLIPPDSGSADIQKNLGQWFSKSNLSVHDQHVQDLILGKLPRSRFKELTPKFIAETLLATRNWIQSSHARTLVRNGRLFQVTQYPGDIVFVPSNWYHATINFAESVSFNQEFCSSFRATSRVQPLGSFVYGGRDDLRELDQYIALGTHPKGSKKRSRQVPTPIAPGVDV